MATADSFLTELATRTAAAMQDVLATVAGGAVEIGAATLTNEPTAAFGSVQAPMIMSEVAYAEGIAGGNLVGIPLSVAYQLAQTAGVDAGDDHDTISDAGLSAVGEIANRMLATAGTIMAEVVGRRVELTAPTTRVVRELLGVLAPYAVARHITSLPFTILGEECRLVQFVPQAFVARMTADEDEPLDEEGATDDEPVAQRPEAVPPASMARTLLHVGVELGRTHMTVGQITSLPDGAIVTLDRKATDPIDVCVNGVPFAFGRLVRSERGIAVVIEGFTGQAAMPAGASGS